MWTFDWQFSPEETRPRQAFELDHAIAKDLPTNEIASDLLPLIRSNHSTISADHTNLLVGGPELSYHQIDPFLPQRLRELGIVDDGVSAGKTYAYGEDFDVCLEDSWSGLFVAEHIQGMADNAPLTIIHLDDHTDMMSTLLLGQERLTDPIFGKPFNPEISSDWPSAIQSGAVGIGSFLTPFFALNRTVTVLHLKAGTGAPKAYAVTPSTCRHPLLGRYAFFDLQLRNPDGDGKHIYVVGEDAGELLSHVAVPESAVVHIDLDYFINDFNGNALDRPYAPDSSLRIIAQSRTDTFFRALIDQDWTIARWIVGTSPGFCSAIHWPFLFDLISAGIRSHARSR